MTTACGHHGWSVVWLGRAVSGGGRTGDSQVGAVENAVVERAVAERGEGIRHTSGNSRSGQCRHEANGPSLHILD